MAESWIEKQEAQRASVGVKRVVDGGFVTKDNFAGAVPPDGGALRRRYLAVGHAGSLSPTCRV